MSDFNKLMLTAQLGEFVDLIKKDPTLTYLAEEYENYWSAVEVLGEVDGEPTGDSIKLVADAKKKFAVTKTPLLDNLQVNTEVSAHANYKAWRQALVKFSEIDQRLPRVHNNKKGLELKTRIEIAQSIKEQPMGNPILHDYQQNGIKGVVDRFGALYPNTQVDR